MSNMSSFIKEHNRNILSSSPNSEERSCNCRNKDNGPVVSSCLKTCIVYRADVIKENETHVYYGASDGEFKYWYNNHTNSFRNQDYENKTELSKHIWQLRILKGKKHPKIELQRLQKIRIWTFKSLVHQINFF